MWGLGTLPDGFQAAAYMAAAGRGYSGYPSFGLPYPTVSRQPPTPPTKRVNVRKTMLQYLAR
ncbi:RNA-binding protein Musashi like Rbp6 [Pseudolycoriella hygida]|uniref:RNA-binding protein Musashi like Rbp6 n=1 Tax=Pseudolycoriella hygida TaxID=35572 RepID=A0A9Q0S5Y3_9DIPT|nr:RNA-binding protein Musashi like Rbp6 [Pseudolycoriella hygida]